MYTGMEYEYGGVVDLIDTSIFDNTVDEVTREELLKEIKVSSLKKPTTLYKEAFKILCILTADREYEEAMEKQDKRYFNKTIYEATSFIEEYCGYKEICVLTESPSTKVDFDKSIGKGYLNGYFKKVLYLPILDTDKNIESFLLMIANILYKNRKG